MVSTIRPAVTQGYLGRSCFPNRAFAVLLETSLVWNVPVRGVVNRCAARNAEPKISKASGFVATAERRWRIAVLSVARTIRPGKDSAAIAAQR